MELGHQEADLAGGEAGQRGGEQQPRQPCGSGRLIVHAREDAAHPAQADQAPRLARRPGSAENRARPAPPTK